MCLFALRFFFPNWPYQHYKVAELAGVKARSAALEDPSSFIGLLVVKMAGPAVFFQDLEEEVPLQAGTPTSEQVKTITALNSVRIPCARFQMLH